jgi:hypothetical protein
MKSRTKLRGCVQVKPSRRQAAAEPFDRPPKLIAATEAGELDGHINAVTKAKQPVVMRR